MSLEWQALKRLKASLSLANDPRFLALMEESRRAYREEGGIGLDELRSELGLKAHGRGRNKKP